MGGYVQLSKDLLTDIRFKRVVRTYIASRERHASDATALSYETGVTHVLGALAQIWIHADTHIRDDDTLEMSADEIDELVGIAGFSKLLPADWFQVLDADCVQLPDFLRHNGTVAKKKSNHAKRQARYRERQKNLANDATASRTDKVSDAGASPSHPIPSHPNLNIERGPPPTTVSRGPIGVVDAGNRLTDMSANAAFSSLLEDWRRDVPQCNPEAFSKWIVHVEESGKPMNSNMRLGQARRLAGNGDFEAQAEVVTFCIENGYRTLIPLDNVRARTIARAPQAPAKKPFTPAPTTAEVEAMEAARARR